MKLNDYIPPYQRVLHQAGIRTLLVAQFFTVLPFMGYMPNWLMIVFLLVVVWRWRVLRGEIRKPPLWLVLTAMMVGIGALLVSGLNRYSLDTAVAFCLLGYLLKSLEVLRRRDGIFQIYLGFFLTGVYLLYRFDIVGGLVLVTLLFVNLSALQAVTSELQFKFKYAAFQSLLLILGAIPVMIAGYLFFPRLPPLWVIPNDQRGAVTGMSDELNPGSVAELARSTAPAFRVSFDGDLPNRSDWYWRGTTLSDFDGETWRAIYKPRNGFAGVGKDSLPAGVGDSFSYSTIMENSGQKWLYFLDWPNEIKGQGVVVLPDGRAAKNSALVSAFRYNAVSSVKNVWPEQSLILESSLELPRTGNAGLKQWAEDFRLGFGSDQAFVEGLWNYIRTESFFYTLRPPLYQGRNAIQDFWFGERRGFCEHYASAAAFILRSAGIPARIVGGYLGGNYINSGNYIQVRQMEAHAWVEVWVGGTWQRFDPTVAVAPGRVETNLDDLFMQTQPNDLPVFSRIARFGLINRVNVFWDSLNYQWQNLVLDYDTDAGIGWFESNFGRISPMKLAVAFLALFGAVALIVAFSLGLIQIPVRVKEPFRSLARIEKLYGHREQGETIQQYLVRIEIDPISTAKLSALINNWLYGKPSGEQRSKLRRLVSELSQQKRQYLGKS